MTFQNEKISRTQNDNSNSCLMTTKSLTLLSEFDEWEFPNLFQLNIPKFCSVDEIWRYANLDLFDKFGLTTDEHQKLEYLMTDFRTEELYTPIFRFTEWCISEAPFDGWDLDEFTIFNTLYNHFITNKGKGSKPHFYDGDELNFWKNYFKLQTFENTLPHFTNSLRNLIHRYTCLKGVFSQETHP